jgi:hypothetical protein
VAAGSGKWPTCRAFVPFVQAGAAFLRGPVFGQDEAVDKHWESDQGHTVASLRYGAISRRGPSEEPERPPDNAEWDDAQRLRPQFIWNYWRERDEEV